MPQEPKELKSISDEDWDNPKPLEGEDLETHHQNIAFVRKMVVSFAIAKFGILTLIAVILWRFFGNGRH